MSKHTAVNSNIKTAIRCAYANMKSDGYSPSKKTCEVAMKYANGLITDEQLIEHAKEKAVSKKKAVIR